MGCGVHRARRLEPRLPAGIGVRTSPTSTGRVMAFAIAAIPSQDASDAPVGVVKDERMRLRLGCELNYHFPQPTPLIAMLNVHFSRFGDLERPDHLITSPA